MPLEKTKIKPVKTELANIPQVAKAFNDFLTKAELDGANLRLEYATGLCGQRITAIFDWDDRG